VVSGALVPVLLDFASVGPPLYLVYPPNRQASARLKAFLAFASEVFAAVDADFHDIVVRATRPVRPKAPRA
jgi:DNA-binding transcriptional LysR family regulator